MSYGRLILLCGLVALAGCQTTQPNLYYWGHYESLLYDMYNKPGDAPPSLQVQKLSEDIERAQATDRRVAPGVYAHLGFMYMLSGQFDLGLSAFQQEKERYPESAVFIDQLIERANSVVRYQKPNTDQR